MESVSEVCWPEKAGENLSNSLSSFLYILDELGTTVIIQSEVQSMVIS